MAITNTLLRQGEYVEYSNGKSYTEVWKCEGFDATTPDVRTVLTIAQNPAATSNNPVPVEGVTTRFGSGPEDPPLPCVRVSVTRKVYAAQVAIITATFGTIPLWWGSGRPIRSGGTVRGKVYNEMIPIWRLRGQNPDEWHRTEYSYPRRTVTAVYEDANPSPSGGNYFGLVDIDSVRVELVNNTGRIKTGFPQDANLKMVLSDFAISVREDNLQRIALYFEHVGPIPAFDIQAGGHNNLGGDIPIPALDQMERYSELYPGQEGDDPQLAAVPASELYETWNPLSFNVAGVS